MVLFRYIFGQLVSLSCAAVGLFVFILITGNVLRDMAGLLVSGKLSLQLFGELLWLLIPYVIAYALPLGLLSAILILFGRLSAQQEIVAMRAAGLSLYHIARPVWVIGFIGVLICLFINLEHAPKSRAAFRERVANVFAEDPLQFIQAGQFIDDFPGYILYADRQEQKILKGLRIWELNPENQITTVLTAQEGHFVYEEKENVFLLKLIQGSAQRRGHPDLRDIEKSDAMPTLFFHEAIIKLPLEGLFQKTTFTKKLSLLTASELWEKRKWLLKKSSIENPKAFEERIAIQMQLQKGIATAFSVFILGFLAFPLGIRVSRVETYANFALALGLAMLYYLSMVMISWLDKWPNMRPDIWIWAPNVILFSIASWSTKKLNRC